MQHALGRGEKLPRHICAVAESHGAAYVFLDQIGLYELDVLHINYILRLSIQMEKATCLKLGNCNDFGSTTGCVLPSHFHLRVHIVVTGGKLADIIEGHNGKREEN